VPKLIKFANSGTADTNVEAVQTDGSWQLI